MEKNKLDRAKKRLAQLKGFYIHLSIYLTINAIILTNFFIRSVETTYDFWSFPTFMTAIFWGVGVLLHATNTFRALPFYTKNWERKRIEKMMKEEHSKSKEYK